MATCHARQYSRPKEAVTMTAKSKYPRACSAKFPLLWVRKEEREIRQYLVLFCHSFPRCRPQRQARVQSQVHILSIGEVKIESIIEKRNLVFGMTAEVTEKPRAVGDFKIVIKHGRRNTRERLGEEVWGTQSHRSPFGKWAAFCFTYVLSVSRSPLPH